MIAAVGSVMRTSAPRAALPAVNPTDPDDVTVEVEPPLVEFAPVQYAVPETVATQDSAMGDQRGPYAAAKAAQLAQAAQVGWSPPAGAGSYPTTRPNATFATGFDAAPAQTSVGMQRAAAAASTPPALARTLSAYSAMRGA